MCHVLNAMLLQKLPSLFPWKHNKTKMMAEPVMEEGYIAEEDLRPCKICGRTFLPAPLVKHTKICEKNATKKRKIFNSLRQRVEGTDLALFHQKTYLKKNREHSPIHSAPAQPVSPVASVPATNVSKPAVLEAPQPPVKEMPVVESIQANKSVESLKPVSSMTGIRKTRSNALMANSTFERCPGCDRQFGPKAYDRHVEWCKEKMSRLPASNINNNQIAKERLEMRTKYRVPPINRNRKTVKEKYQMSSSASPNSAAPPSPSVPNVNSMTNLNRKPNLQRTPSVRQAPTGSTSNLNSPFTNPSDAGRNQGNRRKSEPLKAKRPQVSVLKINSVAVNDTSGLTVSNIHTPVSSSSSHCTPQSESLSHKHPIASPKNLVTWKEMAETPSEPHENLNLNNVKLFMKSPERLPSIKLQKEISKSIVQEPTPAFKDAAIPTEPTRITVDIKLPKLYDSDVEYSDTTDDEFTDDDNSEIKETQKHLTKVQDSKTLEVMNNNTEIDLDYVKTCLDSKNFQTMKLSDAKHLQSNMLLISTNSQQGMSDDQLYIVIKPQETNANDNETNDKDIHDSQIKQQLNVKGFVGNNLLVTYEVHSKKSSSKIPIRPEMRKPKSSDGSKLKLQSIDHFSKDINIQRSMYEDDEIKTAVSEEPSDPNEFIADFVINSPETSNACELVYVSRPSTSNLADDLENKPLNKLDLCTTDQAQIKIDLNHENQSEYDIDEVDISQIDIIPPHNKSQAFFSGIEEDLDSIANDDEDAAFTVKEEPAEKYNIPFLVKDLVGDEIELDGNIDQFSIEELKDLNLYKPVDRHPNLHSETDFQLRKARDMLNLPTYTVIEVFDDKSRFDSFLDCSGMGDVGNSRSMNLKCQENHDSDADQGDAPKKMDVINEYESGINSDLQGFPCDGEMKEVDVFRCENVVPNITSTGLVPYNQFTESVLFERYGKLTEVESLHGIYCDGYSSILSKTRLERELRGCCSEVTLNYNNSDSSHMITASETDLLKFNHLQEMMRNHYEEQNSEPDEQIERDIIRLRISQGTQPEVNYEKNEEVQTEHKLEMNSTGVCSTDNPKPNNSESGSSEKKPDEDGSNDDSNSGTKHSDTDKDTDSKEKDVPFATRIYQNCLHHNIIKIKLRKDLHKKKEDHRKVILTHKKGLEVCPTEAKTNLSIHPVSTESIPSLAKLISPLSENPNPETDVTDVTDSECSTVSKLSPRFQNLVDVILHENRSEIFRLSRKDCKRLIKLNPKKITVEEFPKREFELKLPKITMVLPKSESKSKSRKRIFKTSLHTLPKITESCSTKNKITTTITSNINNDIPNKPNTPDTYNPFATAERQLMELLECDDFKQLNNNKLKVSPIKDKNQLNLTTPNPKLISPTPIKPLGSSTPKQKKRKSVIDPPLDFKDIGHNPQDDIDFEMLENFINDNFGNDELMRKLDLDTISLASCSTKTDNTVSFYDDISIDPRLINDFDNLSIPDNLHTETTTTPDMLRQFPLVHSNRFRLEPLEHQTARNRTTSISSDSSFADLTTAPQYSVQENKKKTNLRRSLLPDPVKPVKNLRSREDVQRYFDGNDSSSPRDHSDTKNDNRECNMVASGGNDELFTVDDEMYEEYKKYEEMYLMEKEEQLRREAEMRANEDSSNHMISADSAYGSLNRSGKTKVRSKITKLSPMEPARVDSASSSGSETCIMQNAPEHSSPINANTMANYSNNAGPGNNNSKLSKFCHECGNRYPLTTAKFCVECGVRRLPDIDKVIKNEDDEHNE